MGANEGHAFELVVPLAMTMSSRATHDQGPLMIGSRRGRRVVGVQLFLLLPLRARAEAGAECVRLLGPFAAPVTPPGPGA